MEFRISSVCCAAFASIGVPFPLGGTGSGPAAEGGVGLAFRALALFHEKK